jgi:hypothetical protein
MTKRMSLVKDLDQLPKKQGARTLAARGAEKYITIHYSGVVYNDLTEATELNRIKFETQYHLDRNWGKKGSYIYGDGLMYDYVVLKSGTIVQTRGKRQQLWHCRNAIGNSESWSLHVMLGPGEPMTGEQEYGLFTLVNELRARTNIPKENVVGHCEWPAHTGVPIISETYRLLPGQSECPGKEIMGAIYRYRNATRQVAKPTPRKWVYLVKEHTTVLTAPREDAPYAVYTATEPDTFQVRADLGAGTVIALDDISNGWGHIDTGIGFVPMSILEDLS